MKIIGKRYRIVRELGSGGMATVYLAEDKVLKRQVAVKMIKTDAIAPNQLKNTRIRFQREGQHLVRMSETPGIVNIYDVGEQRGTPYIVMSYMPGGSLRQHLGKPLPLSKAIRMLLPVMNALTLVHQQGIIHRDLKPGNILLDRYGNLAIADFGIAKAFESQDTALTATGLGVGTAAYMAPEQYHGEVSEQSDLYALGVILYEMVTGAKPFRGATPSKIFEQQVQGEIIDPRQFAGNLPEDLVHILQKALAFDRKDRYASVEALKTALLPLMTPADAAEAASLLQGTRTSPQGGDSKQTILPPAPEKEMHHTPAPPTSEFAKKKSKKWLTATIIGGIFLLAVCVIGGVVALRLWEASIDNQQATRDSAIAQQVQLSATPEAQEPGSITESQEALLIPDEQNPQEEAQETTPTPTATTTYTSQPSPTATVTATPTPAAGEKEQVPPGSGVTITQQNGSTGLDVYLYRGDGSAISNKYVTVHTQKSDLSGNWVTDERVCTGYTDNAGRVQCDLVAGHYIVVAEFSGYNWGSASDKYGEADIPVEQGSRTQMVLRLGRLRVGFVRGDGSVVNNKYVTVHTQRKDITDEWVTDNRVGTGYTDNTGEVVFDLTPGNYVIASEFNGYNWGDAVGTMGESNIPVKAGEVTQLVVHLGRMVVAVKDANGNPVNNKYISLYFQTTDASGNPATGSRISTAYTDNTGTVSFDLTPGVYAVRYDDRDYFNIEVRARTITTTDGENSTFASK